MKEGDLAGDKIVPFYCEKCGYIELYDQKFMHTAGAKPSNERWTARNFRR